MDSSAISIQEMFSHLQEIEHKEKSPAIQSLTDIFYSFFNNTNEKLNHSIW